MRCRFQRRPHCSSYSVKLKNGEWVIGLRAAEGDRLAMTTPRNGVARMTLSTILIMLEGFTALGNERLNELSMETRDLRRRVVVMP